jgi:hypothetical protein
MNYNQQAYAELQEWKHRMARKPNLAGYLSKAAQNRINRIIPEKVHLAITATIKKMVQGVLYGAKYISKPLPPVTDLMSRETDIMQRIRVYQNTAAAEGGITGAGGFLMAMADFPILLGIKIKMLFDIGGMYGFDLTDYKERVFLLHIFELAFSSRQHRRQVFEKMQHWESKKRELPDDSSEFDWRAFQQEYRDYIDLAKLAQLIPGIGAAVGLVVNYRLIKQLGETAMNAYRMRIMEP